MASVLAGDEVTISTSSSRSRSRSWKSMRFQDIWTATAGAVPDVFEQSDRHTQEDDEYHLTWAAIERLPTLERMRKGVMKHVDENEKVMHDEVDVAKLGLHDKKILLDSILKIGEEDNEKFLRKLRDRQDRFGLFYQTLIYNCFMVQQLFGIRTHIYLCNILVSYFWILLICQPTYIV